MHRNIYLRENKMKKKLLLWGIVILIVALVLSFSACTAEESSGEVMTPEEVVTAYLDAAIEGDEGTMFEYNEDFLENEKVAAIYGGNDVSYEIVETNDITDEVYEAEVVVTVTGPNFGEIMSMVRDRILFSDEEEYEEDKAAIYEEAAELAASGDYDKEYELIFYLAPHNTADGETWEIVGKSAVN
jgi:Icc-related predicted phosphoesterase